MRPTTSILKYKAYLLLRIKNFQEVQGAAAINSAEPGPLGALGAVETRGARTRPQAVLPQPQHTPSCNVHVGRGGHQTAPKAAERAGAWGRGSRGEARPVGWVW